jgi:2-polyprenyl-6-methoxyphenol hydroxylase-like FAD-dependent oxidoreductase
MAAVNKIAIAGSGVAALALAIELSREGVHVDVFEKKPELSAVGSGITLQGNALRILDHLDVWERARESAFPFDGLVLRAPGPDAPVIAAFPEVKTGGPGFPAGAGMYRPDLNRIMYARALELGVNVMFAASVDDLTDHGDTVEVSVNGESVGTYDLLVGADGLHSTVRSLIGITARPQPTGMGAWRAIVSRPEEVTSSELYYGGQVYIAGYTPISDDSMYAFLVNKAADHFAIAPQEGIEIMRRESLAYGGPWEAIRADLSAQSLVNYTWFTSHIVDGAWNRGRSVIIGDAAHSCPPTIAQGAAQALEDAHVLAELLLTRTAIDEDLWAHFHARRGDRARAIVEASVQLGQWQIDGVHDADTAGLIVGIATLVAEPA